jgi:hypothetical protein
MKVLAFIALAIIGMVLYQFGAQFFGLLIGCTGVWMFGMWFNKRRSQLTSEIGDWVRK